MNAASLQFFIAPKCWKGDLTLVRPEEVQRWNHIRLSKEDVQTKFVRHLMVLLENNQYAQLDQQSFDLLGLTFCIPTESGEYFDLIPHGRYIAVRQENACEFFIRFKYAVDTAVGRPASYCAAAEDVLGYGSIAVAPHPQPASAAAVAPAAVSSDTSPEEAAVVNGKKAENEKHQFLVVEDDLVALDQFDAAARAMLSDHAEAQSISVDGLRWAITLRDKVEIPLIQHGARTYVDQTEAEAFYRAIIDKVQEVRKEVLQNGCYRPDNEEDDGAAQVAASPGQASGQANADAEDAVNASSSLYQREMEEVRRSQHMRATARPLSPTEKELALFSPSHLTCGLFSPPQHVSI